MVLEEAHGELDAQDPGDGVVDPAHGHHTTVDAASQDADELLVVVRHHELQHHIMIGINSLSNIVARTNKQVLSAYHVKAGKDRSLDRVSSQILQGW